MSEEEFWEWACERPEWGEPGEWNLGQWESRSSWIADKLDPREACAMYLFIGIEYGGDRDVPAQRQVSERLCWFHPRLGTGDYWVTEDDVMRQRWSDLTPHWDQLLEAAFARRIRLDEKGGSSLTGS